MAPNTTKEYTPVVLEPVSVDISKQNFYGDCDQDHTVEMVRRMQASMPTTDDPKLVSRVHVEDIQMPRSSDGKSIELTVSRPLHSENEVLPVVLYLHGGGWLYGNKHTHRQVCVELTDRCHACVIFVTYSLAPDVQFPVALEECYDALKYVTENSGTLKVDPKNIIVSGDSAGGNLSACLTQLAWSRDFKVIKGQALLYPSIAPNFDNDSMLQFEKGYMLTRGSMVMHWEVYCPNDYDNRFASPIKASLDQLKDLPPALVTICEADVLRDDGEAYARKMAEAGVDVLALRYLGVIHGCLMFPKYSRQAEAMLNQTVAWMKERWAASA